MKKLALDVDGVLYPLFPNFLRWYNLEFSTSLKHSDITHDVLHPIFGITADELHARLDTFSRTELAKSLKPYPSALTAVPLLAKKYELTVISARPEHLYDETVRWIRENFGSSIGEINFSGHITQTSYSSGKVNLCKSLCVETLVEDTITHANACAEQGVKAYLIQRPWNKHRRNEIHQDVRRVKSLKEIT